MAELERLERRMERKWHDLAMAEQRGQQPRALERMYNNYLQALDEFISCQRRLNGQQGGNRLAS
ncbi:MAG: hypothetical protein ACRDHE_11160 [Ktedonobacterales bacterium]